MPSEGFFFFFGQVGGATELFVLVGIFSFAPQRDSAFL